jgi:hypothetical protein
MSATYRDGAALSFKDREERGDEAIQRGAPVRDCFASLAMTNVRQSSHA